MGLGSPWPVAVGGLWEVPAASGVPDIHSCLQWGEGCCPVSFRVPWSVLDDHGADAGACVRAVACHDPLGILGVKTAVFL